MNWHFDLECDQMYPHLRDRLWYPPAETKIPWPAFKSLFAANPAFQTELQNYLGVKRCVLGDHARGLLFTLLYHLGRRGKEGRDEVLIPGYTCYSVAAAVAKAGFKISLYDIDPKTLQPDINSVKKNLRKNTLAVIAQQLFGIISSLDEIRTLTDEHDIYLILDSAQALGRDQNGSVPEMNSDFGLYSFGRGKPLPVGSGGALVANKNMHILDEIQFYSHKKGCLQILQAATMQFISKPVFYKIFEMLPLGLGKTVFDMSFYSGGIPSFVSKLLSGALPYLDKLNEHRRRIASKYEEYIPVSPLTHANATSIIRYPAIIDERFRIDTYKKHGIRRMYPMALLKENTIRPFIVNHQVDTPGSEEISKKLITLPTHRSISIELAEQIGMDLVRSIQL